MRRYFNEKIDLWAILAKLIIIVLLVLLVFDYVVYRKARETDLQSFVNISKYVTSHTEESVSCWIEDASKTAEYIAEADIIIEACVNPYDINKRDEATEFLNEMYEKYDYNENVGIVLNNDEVIKLNIDGSIIEIESNTVFMDSLDGYTLGQRHDTMPYIEEAFKENNYFISEVHSSDKRERPIIVMLVPIKNNDEIIGAAFLALKVDIIIERFLKTNLEGETGYVFLTDERGYIVAHKNTDFILSDGFKNREDFKESTKKIIEGQTLIESSLYQKDKYYYSQEILFDEDISQREIYAVFTMDNDVIFNSSRNILWLITLVFFVGLILIVFTSFNISKNRYNYKREKELEEEVEIRTKQLKELAEKDSLTGCLNHKSLFAVLDETIANSKKNGFVVAMMDIDNFKKVNDKYGHPKGDEVIEKVAEVIKNSLRDDDIVGRYGGEEFLAIMPSITKKQSERIAERIRKNIENLVFEPEIFNVTISIGVVLYKNENAIQLVNRADKLMYEAKKKGKNQVMANQE